MKNFLSKVKSRILGIWKDPVGSGIILFIITAILTWGWNTIDVNSFTVFKGYIFDVLKYRLPFWISILFGLAIWMCLLIYRRFKKKDTFENNPIWNEQLGDYTTKELYLILLKQTLPFRTRGMMWSDEKPPADNLIILLSKYEIFFSHGVSNLDNIHDGGYAYGILAPKLLQYQLVGCKTEKDKHDIEKITYQTSDLGRKFISNLERLGIKHESIEDKQRLK